MDPTEEWRPVVGHPRYMVSDQGRVRSHHKAEPKLLKLLEKESGYFSVNLADKGVVTTRSVHVLVAEAFHGPRPLGHEVRHLDGKRQNNQATNLAWGTPSENEQDKLRHGTHPHASKTHCPKGHPYDETNTYVHAHGNGRRRNCRPCAAANQRRRRMAKVALPADEAAAQLATAGAR